ncbi:MAG TPA: hypothetical protein VFR94_19630 [Nitrososphaeraceae archaeon]|nr:hypothetical protein [Nitrososphaeraceae archaeon]
MSNSKHYCARIICIVLTTSLTTFILPEFVILNEAVAQPPYLNVKTAKVSPDNSKNVSIFCKVGDGMISGGYSIGFSSVLSAFDTMVSSNHPIQLINQTGYFEGWEAGLVNRGNATAELTASTLCLDLTLSP